MKGIFFSLLSLFVCGTVFADPLDLNTALQNTYRACVDIDDNLHELKVLAGVNTGVSAVGTGLGVGATAAGLAKAHIDKEIEQLFIEIRDLSNEYQGDDPTEEEKQDWYQQIVVAIDNIDWKDPKIIEKENQEIKRLKELNDQYVDKEAKSKKLGNWRTGLLAGNTVTNVAGAIISSKTINKHDLQDQIDACISAAKNLNNAIIVAKMNDEYVGEAQDIYEACREFEYVDISSINKRGTGSMIASSVGAGLGGIGTVTSGVANSDKIRNENSDAGREKEKNLNTAANVLSVGATVASATALVFKATQVSAIKKVATVAQKCTEVLK